MKAEYVPALQGVQTAAPANERSERASRVSGARPLVVRASTWITLYGLHRIGLVGLWEMRGRKSGWLEDRGEGVKGLAGDMGSEGVAGGC